MADIDLLAAVRTGRLPLTQAVEIRPDMKDRLITERREAISVLIILLTDERDRMS